MSKNKEVAETYEDNVFIEVDPEAEAAAALEVKGNDLMDALLNTPDQTTTDVYMKRFGTHFTLRAIDSGEYRKLEKRCTYHMKNKRTGKISKELDEDKFSYVLINAACINPKWSNPQLLEKYNTSDPCDVIQKRLYIGEITELTQAIMDISGFSDEVEEIKN